MYYSPCIGKAQARLSIGPGLPPGNWAIDDLSALLWQEFRKKHGAKWTWVAP